MEKRLNFLTLAFVFLFGLAFNAAFAQTVLVTHQDGNTSALSLSTDGGTNFVSRSTTDGLGANRAYHAVSVGNNIYVATFGGLSISTDGGSTFVNRTTANGLGANFVNSVEVLGNTILAGTFAGFSISTDGGTSFVNRTTANGLGSNVVQWVFVDGSTIYAATDGGLSVSTDDGASFTNQTFGGGFSDNVRSVYADGNNIYAATLGGLYISTNGGSSYSLATLHNTGSTQAQDVLVSGNTLYVATNRGLSISTDGGSTFATRTTSDGLGADIMRGVDVDGNTVYAATNGGLSVSTDGGSSFSNRTTTDGLGETITNSVTGSSAGASSAKPIYVTHQDGNTSALSISSDGGASFVSRSTADGLGANRGYDVYAEGNTLYVATFGGLSISTDGGSTFVNRTTADGLGDNFVNSLDKIGNTILAATFGGLSISTDGGTSFVNRTTADGLGANAVQRVLIDGGKVYAATAGGLSISTDGAATFTNQTFGGGASDNVRSVYADGNNIYAATLGGLYISTNGGASYSLATLHNSGSTQAFDVLVSGNILYVATNRGLSISSDNGSTFATRTTADGLGADVMRGIAVCSDTVYAATNGGLSVSIDGGISFSNRTTLYGLGETITNNVSAKTQLSGPVSTMPVYATHQDGNTTSLSISNDGGASFSSRSTADGLGSNKAYDLYADGNTLYVATFGGLSISSDGGTTFTNRTTANGLGDDFVAGVLLRGNTLYAATFGGVSISTDGGNTFTNRTTADGLGANEVRRVFIDSGIIYAATSGGLSASSDGGATFTNKTFGGGFNDNVRAVYADGNDIYAATLGGLYISNDGGTNYSLATLHNSGTTESYDVLIVNNILYVATDRGLKISSDGGSTFATRTTADGLGSDTMRGVDVSGDSVFAATDGGFSVSGDGGVTFTNRTTLNGLGENITNNVFVKDHYVPAPEIAVTPQSLAFGQVELGQSAAAQTVTISNAFGTVALNVSSVTSSSSEFAVSGFTSGSIPAGSSQTFDVSYTPSGLGTDNETITIASDDSDEPSVVVNVSGEGIPVPVPEMDVQGGDPLISISDEDNTPQTADSTDFGDADLNSGVVSHSFTIVNSGDAALNLGDTKRVVIGGDHPADFTVTDEPETPVAASGGTTTFTIAFDPSALGLRKATVSIANDDSDENPYNFTIQGTGTVPPAPEMDVQGGDPLISISDGDDTPQSADSTDFGNADINSGVVSHSFTIVNSGDAALNLSGSPLVVIAGDHPGDFTVTQAPGSNPVAASGGTSTFIIAFDPSASGLRKATVSIANDDGDENPYNFAIQGTGTEQLAPEMDVQGGDPLISISDEDNTPQAADSTDFGSADINGDVVSHSFTIVNSGNAALNLTGSPLVVIGGDHPGDFTVTQAPGSNPVAASGGTSTFIIEFDPSATGLRKATVSIANDDSDENPYNFAIQGTGTEQTNLVQSSLYVTNWSEGSVSVIDRGSNSVIAIIPVGELPRGIVLNPNGASAYVTTFRSNDVKVIDIASNTVRTTIPVGRAPLGMAVTPDGASLYVANVSDDNITVIDVASNTVRTTIPVGEEPSGIAVSPDGVLAYVTNTRSETVSVIDVASSTVDTTIQMGGRPGNILVTPDGASVYVGVGVELGSTTVGRVSVIDVASNTVTGSIAPGGNIAMSPDGTSVYSLRSSALFNDVSVIDVASNTVRTSFSVAFSSDDIAVSPDGGSIYVSDGRETITVYDAANNEEVQVISGLLSTGIIAILGDSNAPTPVPEMDVKGGGFRPTSISDGDDEPQARDNTYFGYARVGGASVNHSFTIENTGNAELLLSGSPIVTISGDHAADFTVFQPASPVPPRGGTRGFTIRFEPLATGVRNATVSIANNDSDENPYNFAIQGIGSEFDIFNGSLSLRSQSQVDAFDYFGITGTLTISGSDITNLDGLSTLTFVSGDFNISSTAALTDISGLSALTSVGRMNIRRNSALTDISGLSALTSLPNLSIEDNSALTNITGFAALASIANDLTIRSNSLLNGIDGLSALTSVGRSLNISSNSALTDIDVLPALTSVVNLSIQSNAALTNITGLSALTSVTGNLYITTNPALTNITGVNSLESVVRFLISGNPVLTNIDGFQSLDFSRRFYIRNNSELLAINGFSGNSLTAVSDSLEISGNPKLLNLNGLSKLTAVGGVLKISANAALTDFRGIHELVNGGGLLGSYEVTDNAFNPTATQVILAGPPADPGDPTGFAVSHPDTVPAGGPALLTVTVTPGADPVSTGLAVSVDLSGIGGSATQTFYDDGSNGDVTSGDNVFSYRAAVPITATPGEQYFPVSISDAEARTASASLLMVIVSPGAYELLVDNAAQIEALAANASTPAAAISDLNNALSELAEAMENIDKQDVYPAFRGMEDGIEDLQKAAEDGADVAEFITAIYDIANLLAQTAYSQAQNYAGSPVVDDYITDGEEFLAEALAELDDENPDQAVRRLGSAYKAFQWAIHEGRAIAEGETAVAAVNLIIPAIQDSIDTAGYSVDANDELEDAIEKLNRAILDFSDGEIKSGYNDLRAAVKQLQDAEEEGAAAADEINGIVDLARMLAEGKLAAARAYADNPDAADRIADAEAGIADAEAELADGHPDVAVKEYRDAWEDARVALEDGRGLRKTGEGEEDIAIPKVFALEQNYPNPFNPSTTIKFALPEAVSVTLKIYNVTGQLVKTLVQENMDAGFHNVIWNGQSSGGVQVSSGIYFYQITAGNFKKAKKMILLK